MMVHVGNRDIIPLHLSRGFGRERCLVRITSRTKGDPLKVPHYPLYMKLDGPHSQAGYYREDKNI
jgi:hypothetical protein